MNLIHGYARRKNPHRLYSRWYGMIQRCYCPKHASYKWYGAKGIKVCDRWMSFANFLEDMGHAWKPGLTLERKDNNCDYCPGNVIWDTTHNQRLNDSHGAVATIGGKTQRLTRFAEDLGMTSAGIYRRLKHGWTTDRALTTPPRRGRMQLTHNGETKTVDEWAKLVRGERRIIEKRLALGWSVERAVTTPSRRPK